MAFQTFPLLLILLTLALGSVPPSWRSTMSSFEVHGWRWHNLSVLHGYRRLSKLCDDAAVKGPEGSADRVENIRETAKYLVEFNHRTLVEIENKVFKPWLDTTLPPSSSATIRHCWSLKSGLDSIRSACSETLPSLSYETLPALSSLCDAASSCLLEAVRVQDSSVVPLIVAGSTRRQQKRLNSRILRSLGISDARMHLAAMWDVVRGTKEEEVWEEKIPAVARRMVRGWRGYGERAGMIADIRPDEVNI